MRLFRRRTVEAERPPAKLVVGLGNPGPRYAATRHNAGFRVLACFAGAHGIALDAARFEGAFGRGTLPAAGERPALDVALLAPLTFMNRSGRSVAAALAGLEVADPAADLLVIVDDVDLPFGRLRLRPGGSAGGHRGLADIAERLGHRDFPRLRFGVGRPLRGDDTADYVLQPFGPDEERALPPLLERAATATLRALRDGVDAAMSDVNRAPTRDSGPPAAEGGAQSG